MAPQGITIAESDPGFSPELDAKWRQVRRARFKIPKHADYIGCHLDDWDSTRVIPTADIATLAYLQPRNE